MSEPSRNLLVTPTNSPDAAEEGLRAAVRRAPVGSWIMVHSPIPIELERWARRSCAQRGVTIKFCGRGYKFTLRTPADERARVDHERQRLAHEDWINSPG